MNAREVETIVEEEEVVVVEIDVAESGKRARG